MKKKKVFIPVDAEKGLPKVDQWYFTYTEDRFDGFDIAQSLGVERFNTKTNRFEPEDKNSAQPTHWLKEQEGYFFTPEQMEQFAIQCRSKVLNTVIEYIKSLNIK